MEPHVPAVRVPPSRLVEHVPPALEDLIVRLLAKNARDRLGHARDVVSVLAELGADPGDWLAEKPGRDYPYRPRFVGREQAIAAPRDHIRRAHEGGKRRGALAGQGGVGKAR